MAPPEKMTESAAKAEKAAAEEKERVEQAAHKAEAAAEEHGSEARQRMAAVGEKLKEHLPHGKS